MGNPLLRLLARLTTPLTYLLWAMIIVGMLDHFYGPFLPAKIAELGFFAIWLTAAAVWFGWRQRKRDDAASQR